MGILKSEDIREYDLDNDYYINKVSLNCTEEEHTHRFIELVYTLGGRGVHSIDGKDYHVKAGDMLIINYHRKHKVTPIENLCYVDIMLKPEYVNAQLRGTEDIFLILTLQDFSDLCFGIIKDNLLLHLNGDEMKRTELLLDWTEKEQNSDLPAKDVVARSALSLLLCLVFRKMAEKQNAKLSLNDRLLEYISNNCSSRIIIGDIAARCGYTAEHFSRLFKEYSGKSPTSYIGQCRIEKAKRLLLETDKSIEQIIFDCGFTNRTLFFKKFSASVGLTPLQFRKNQK